MLQSGCEVFLGAGVGKDLLTRLEYVLRDATLVADTVRNSV